MKLEPKTRHFRKRENGKANSSKHTFSTPGTHQDKYIKSKEKKSTVIKIKENFS